MNPFSRLLCCLDYCKRSVVVLLMRWEMFDILEEDEEAASPLSSSPAPIITSPGKQNRKNSLLKVLSSGN
jgi:hypothetical protein